MESENNIIVHIIDSIGEGGAQVLINEYAKQMHNEYNIYVLTIYNNDSYNMKKLKRYANVKTVYARRNIFTQIFNKLFGKWYIPYKYKKYINQIRPEIIHMHLYSLSYMKKIYNHIGKVKLFYTCHSKPERIFGGSRSEEGEAATFLLQHSNLKMIALHDEMKSEIEHRFNYDKCVVINNGIDIKEIREADIDIKKKRESLNISQDSFVVGHVGRFTKVKNHRFLVDVFCEILKIKDAYLIMVGSGELIDEIKNMVSKKGITDNVIFLQDRNDVLELLQLMDIYVFPSFVEGLSMSLLEAQAVGLRCIVSDSIEKSNFLTDDTIPVSLNKSAEEWAGIALDTSMKNGQHGNLEDYDIHKSINDLVKLYFVN